MATYALGGWQTLSQKYLTNTIASQSYAKSALLYALAGLNGGDGDMLQIGRPNEGAVFSGAPVSKADKMTLPNKLSYNPRIQGFKTNNTAVIGARANMTTVASPTTASQGQAVQNTAQFNWMQYLQTPLEIWHSDIDAALQGVGDDGAGLAVGQLIQSAMNVGQEEHIDQLASRLLYGTPTNQYSLPNDDLQGVIAAGTSNNVYGQVDRAPLASDDPWQPVFSSSAFPNDIYKIVNWFNVTQKMNVFGGGINLILAGGDNYLIYKNQILSRTKDAGMVGGGEGLPNMAKMGVVREVLRADNVYVMHEPFLDTCYGNQAGTTTPLYTAQPGYVIGLNLKLWKLMFKPKYNMKVTPWEDISNKSVGAPKANISFIETCSILACDRPRIGVGILTNLS